MIVAFLVGAFIGLFAGVSFGRTFAATEPSEHERALAKQLAELRQLSTLPASFWLDWDRHHATPPDDSDNDSTEGGAA